MQIFKHGFKIEVEQICESFNTQGHIYTKRKGNSDRTTHLDTWYG